MHLAASHFMQKIAPSSMHKLLKKAKEATKNTGIDEDLNMDELNIDLVDFNGNGKTMRISTLTLAVMQMTVIHTLM